MTGAVEPALGEARERSQLGVVTAEARELMSLVSPQVSQLLLSLVMAGPGLGTVFACSGTPVLILLHYHALCLLPHPRLHLPASAACSYNH